MKTILICICILGTLLLSACRNRKTAALPAEAAALPATTTSTTTSTSESKELDTGNTQTQESGAVQAVNVTVGGKAYRAVFYDNEAAEELVKRMPVELTMEELHGNEKYFYLPDSLPTGTENIGSIHAGDIMLFGSDCLVLFYENFQTTFRYTRIGSIEAPEGLTDALGNGSVRVVFDTAD